MYTQQQLKTNFKKTWRRYMAELSAISAKYYVSGLEKSENIELVLNINNNQIKTSDARALNLAQREEIFNALDWDKIEQMANNYQSISAAIRQGLADLSNQRFQLGARRETASDIARAYNLEKISTLIKPKKGDQEWFNELTNRPFMLFPKHREKALLLRAGGRNEYLKRMAERRIQGVLTSISSANLAGSSFLNAVETGLRSLDPETLLTFIKNTLLTIEIFGSDQEKLTTNIEEFYETLEELVELTTNKKLPTFDFRLVTSQMMGEY